MSRSIRAFLAVWAAGPAGLLVGCAALPPETSLPVEDLVAHYNENARKAPFLKAEAKIEIDVYDPDSGLLLYHHGSMLSPPSATIFLLKDPERPNGPHDFALYEEEIGGQKLFAVGSSTLEKVYYISVEAFGKGGLWYGRNALAGARGVRMPRQFQVNPLQLPSVLGVTDLPDDLGAAPAPVLTLRHAEEPFAYVLLLIDRQPVSGHLVLQRRMYFNWNYEDPKAENPVLAAPRLFRVEFLDLQGRTVMTADLSDYVEIDTEALADLGMAPDVPPQMPSDIELVQYDPRTMRRILRMRLRITDAYTPLLMYDEICRMTQVAGGGLDRAVLIDADLGPDPEQGGDAGE